MNKKIAIILPNKEDFTKNNAGAASLWVKNFNKYSYYNETLIYGNATNKNYLTKLIFESTINYPIYQNLKFMDSL